MKSPTRIRRRLLAWMILVFACFIGWLLASTCRHIIQTRRIYRNFYTIENDRLQWTDAGKRRWVTRSVLNRLRACYLLDRALPQWGYVVNVRRFQNATFSVSWDPQDDSTLVVYRPDPKKPLPFNQIAEQLTAQERRDFIGTHLQKWLNESPPLWMRLRTISTGALQPLPKLFKSAQKVSLPEDSTLINGIQAEINVSSETWTLLVFGPNRIPLNRLEEFTKKLIPGLSPQIRLALDNEIARLRPNGVYNATQSAGLALAMGQWGTAINTMRQMKRERQQDVSFYKSFGTDMRIHGKFLQSAYGFQRMAESSPDDPFAWENMGDSLVLARQYSIAIAVYRRLIKLRPNSVEARLRLAKAYGQIGDFEKTLESYQTATHLEPRNAASWEGAAAAENALNQPVLALPLANRALALNPLMSEALDDVCVAYMQLKQPKEALKACVDAVRIARTKPAAYVTLGNLLFHAQNYPQALAAFKKADAVGASARTTLAYEAFIYAKTDHLKESAAAFERCLKVDPRNIKLHSLLTQVYAKMGDGQGVLRERKALAALSLQVTAQLPSKVVATPKK